MKRLSLNINFKLPEDFKGDLNDAIDELVKYRRSIKNHNDNFIPNSEKSIYENWWDMIHSTDRVLYGEYNISKMDENNTWIDIEN